MLTGTLGLQSPAWRLLCLGATISSVVAAITTNLSKSLEIGSKILQAQTCDAKLEGLVTLIELEHIELREATSQYAQHLTAVPFL